MTRKSNSNTVKLAAAAAISMGLSLSASAQVSGDTVKIGLLTDMAGVHSDISGQGGVEAIKMAIADFGGNVNGKKIGCATVCPVWFRLVRHRKRSGQVVIAGVIDEAWSVVRWLRA